MHPRLRRRLAHNRRRRARFFSMHRLHCSCPTQRSNQVLPRCCSCLETLMGSSARLNAFVTEPIHHCCVEAMPLPARGRAWVTFLAGNWMVRWLEMSCTQIRALSARCGQERHAHDIARSPLLPLTSRGPRLWSRTPLWMQVSNAHHDLSCLSNALDHSRLLTRIG